jgi:2-polyprenyl-3-methyl-5-hydroxy-6-metoxy-1,4-benzoquinol methylase
MPEDNVTPLKSGTEQLQFDGERFVPGAAVEISYHHWLRYFFALQFAEDKRVLDIASGEGYGAAYLASRAKKVDGFDISAEAVAHAVRTYGDNPRVSFTRSDLDSFFRDAQPESYDLVTAFEVIEHVDDREQIRLLEGIRKVLSAGGVAIVSSPDKQLYSDVRMQKNPFHVHEMYREEFAKLLESIFPFVRMFEQLTYTGSALFESGATQADLCEMAWTDLLRLKGRCQPGLRGAGEYLVAVVSGAPLEQAPASSVILDRARKLIGEELDERRRGEQQALAEARHLRDVVEDQKKQIAEIKQVWVAPEEAARRDALIDRLLALATRRGPSGGEDGEYYRTLYLMEKQQLEQLRSMVSMRMVQRAKRVWDRVPFLKNTVKAVVKRVL